MRSVFENGFPYFFVNQNNRVKKSLIFSFGGGEGGIELFDNFVSIIILALSSSYLGMAVQAASSYIQQINSFRGIQLSHLSPWDNVGHSIGEGVMRPEGAIE